MYISLQARGVCPLSRSAEEREKSGMTACFSDTIQYNPGAAVIRLAFFCRSHYDKRLKVCRISLPSLLPRVPPAPNPISPARPRDTGYSSKTLHRNIHVHRYLQAPRSAKHSPEHTQMILRLRIFERGVWEGQLRRKTPDPRSSSEPRGGGGWTAVQATSCLEGSLQGCLVDHSNAPHGGMQHTPASSKS